MKFTVITTLLATAAVANAQSSSSAVATGSSNLFTLSTSASASASTSTASASALVTVTGSNSAAVVSSNSAAVVSSASTPVSSPVPTQTWFPSGPITPPAALPPQTWNILQLNIAQRQSVCTNQMAACTNNCGGPGKDPKNFCNTTSMAWGCGCSSKSPDYPPYLWPIVETECTDKAQACQSECLTESNAQMSACQVACTSYFQCGTANAPPSYLETNSSTDIPSYVAPSAANTATTATSTPTKGFATKNTAELLGSVVLAIVVIVGVTMV